MILFSMKIYLKNVLLFWLLLWLAPNPASTIYFIKLSYFMNKNGFSTTIENLSWDNTCTSVILTLAHLVARMKYDKQKFDKPSREKLKKS